MTQYPGLTQREAQKNRLEYGDNLLQKAPVRIRCGFFWRSFRI